jgi:hypothetical protein
VTTFETELERDKADKIKEVASRGAAKAAEMGYDGEAIRGFLVQKVFQNRWRFSLARVSGQPTLVAYLWNDSAGAFKLAVLNLLTFRDAQVAAISSFLDDALLARFGLPATWPGDS